MKISKEYLKFLSEEILLDINDDDLNEIIDELNDIAKKLKFTKNINTKNISAMHRIFDDPIKNTEMDLIDDNNFKNLKLSETLQNAPEIEKDFIVIKKVV